MKKKMVALLLSGIMVVSTLAGCGSTDTGAESSAAENAVSESTTQESGDQAAAEPAEAESVEAESGEFDPRSVTEGVKLTIAAPMNVNVIDYETNEMTLAIEERLGVDLEFEVYASETYDEKLNVMINGGDELPDIIIGSNGPYLEWADAGAIIDTAEYFENPDYAKSMYDMMEVSGIDIVEAAKTLEGKIWGYPSYYTDAEGTVAYNLMIDEEWAKAVGFEELPSTTDEFLELARAFKAAGDVNGNGQDDEVFLTGRGDNLDWFQGLMNSFVYAWGHNYLINEDGKLSFAYTTDEWKEGLKYIRTFFEEGLIDTGALTNDNQAYRDIQRDAEGRICADVFYWVIANDNGASDNNFAKQADWVKPVFLSSPVNDDVKSYYSPATPFFQSFITADCENPLAAFLVLDLVASRDEFSLIQRLGKQGERWDYWENLTDEWFAERGLTKDDYVVKVGTNDDGQHFAYEWSGVISEPQNASWDRIAPVLYNDIGISRVYNTGNPDEYEYTVRRQEATTTAIQDYLPGDILVTAVDVEMTVEEKDQYADVFAALDSYISESIGSFLIGTWDIDTYWDTYLAELEKIGIAEALEMYQTAYDRKAE